MIFRTLREEISFSKSLLSFVSISFCCGLTISAVRGGIEVRIGLPLSLPNRLLFRLFSKDVSKLITICKLLIICGDSSGGSLLKYRPSISMFAHLV